MIQSGGFLGKLLGPLLRTGLSLMNNVIKPSAKSVSISLGLTAAASPTDARMHKKILGSGHIMLAGKGFIRAGEGTERSIDLRDLHFLKRFDSTTSFNEL